MAGAERRELLTLLPCELIAHVLTFLDDADLARAVPSCLAFRECLAPHLWQTRLRGRFPHSTWDTCGTPCATLASLASLRKTAWTTSRAEGTAPADRGGHSCVGLRGGRWQFVFGGANGDALFGDAYLLVAPGARGGSFRWQPLRLAAGPCARWAHTAVAWRDTAAVVFGGHSGVHGALGDIAVLEADSPDPGALQWAAPSRVRTVGGAAPPPRYGHAACTRGDEMWVSGGIVGGFFDAQAASDLHVAELAGTDAGLELRWSERRPHGAAPEARFGHSLCSAAGALWLFGGRTQPRHAPMMLEVSAALHALRGLGAGEALRWEQVRARGEAPVPRAFHACAALGETLLLLGGESGLPSEAEEIAYLADVHALRCAEGGDPPCWEPLAPHAPEGTPLAPASSLAAVCLVDDLLLIFGGFNTMSEADLGALHLLALCP